MGEEEKRRRDEEERREGGEEEGGREEEHSSSEISGLGGRDACRENVTHVPGERDANDDSDCVHLHDSL